MAFPLHPETPPEGKALEDLFAGRHVNIAEMMAKLKKVAATEDLPFGARTMTYNSRLAQELGKWAEEEGKGDAFHQSMFRVYFAEGRNIADEAVLLEVAASVSLDELEAKRILQDRIFKDAVDNDWQRAYDLGITAAPTFLMDIRRLVGAQAYEVLEKFIQT